MHSSLKLLTIEDCQRALSNNLNVLLTFNLPVDVESSSLAGFVRWINTMNFLELDVLLVAFSAVFVLSRLSFYGQLLEEIIVASLFRPINQSTNQNEFI